MKILLDECVPWPIYKLLPDHQCVPAQRRGWGGVKNGALLRLADPEFDLFITAARGFCRLRCRRGSGSHGPVETYSQQVSYRLDISDG